MKAYVVLATKGRPTDIPIILNLMKTQTMKPDHVVVVGTSEGDLGNGRNVAAEDPSISFEISKRPGLPIQRNVGIEAILNVHGSEDNAFFIAYFDDDYRPQSDWVEQACHAFESKDIVGMTGWVLADGITGPGISEVDAKRYLSGELPPEPHESRSHVGKSLESAYGCNMAFNGSVSRTYRFDEHLPAYGWLEDRDYTGQALAQGRVMGVGACKGVHLGTKSGRVSGVKFGYSQIANPVFLARKGTMKWWHSGRMMGRNILANHAKTLRPEAWVDRKGRMKGNWIGLFDMVRGRIHPERINDF